MTEKGPSPFTPGSPAPIELFVGRAEQILQIMRSIDQSVAGRQQNVFLVGDRGVGKTSIAAFVRFWAKKERNVVSVQVFLGGVESLEEMVRRIFESLLKVTKGEQWFEKVRSLFGDFVKEIGLFGVSVGFSPPKDDLDQLVRNFPQSLSSLLDEIADDVDSIFIVLDDLDTLSGSAEFANWYKSFVDEVATHFEKYPATFMLIGLPGIIDSLSALQPSLMRIFNVIELEKLTDDEVREFLTKAYTDVEMTIEEDALNLMVGFSSGVPVIMHELGDAAFWVDEDGVIDSNDALDALLTAATRIGNKYLAPQVYRAIRSRSYRSILRKLAQRDKPLNRTFSRQEAVQLLSDSEKKAFDNFVRRLRQIGIIELDTEMGRGYYRFVNDIYPVYIYLEAKKYEAEGA